jgi:methionyl-tRNA synthetase
MPYWDFWSSPIWVTLFSLAVAWSAVWKGIALWRAGRNGSLIWFIVLLLVNTLGILEIIYIFGLSQKKEAKPSA